MFMEWHISFSLTSYNYNLSVSSGADIVDDYNLSVSSGASIVDKSWVGKWLQYYPIFAQSLVFCLVFCRSLFVILSIFAWSLCWLCLLDLRILIAISSNNSCVFTKTTELHIKQWKKLNFWLFKTKILLFSNSSHLRIDAVVPNTIL